MKNVKTNVFEYGAKWVKTDFHLHTKADKEFTYKGDEDYYVSEYIEKLKQTNTEIGVIANHNKFDFEEFKELEKHAKNNGLKLFPGVELSVNDGTNGIHLIIVFSNQWIENNQDYINPLLTNMFPGKTQIQFQNENGRSDKNLIAVNDEIKKYNKDYFFIFPHVEEKCGLWNEFSGGKIKDFGELDRYKDIRRRTLGFQKVRTRTLRNLIKSHLGSWYPAEVEGSDCKSISEIGNKKGETWLKIGAFSFEAVKFALIDNSNRLKNSRPPECSHSYIKSITFDGGLLDNKTIKFSPELNTFIGIRGSGKSSVLESIRYTLGIPFGEQAMDENYKRNLVLHTLRSGGKAIINAVDAFGQEYQIKRIYDENPEVFMNGILQPGVSIRTTIIKKPIYFGQKDLSSSGEGFEKDLVEKLLGQKLYNIRLKIEDKKSKVIEIINQVLKSSDIDEQMSEYEAKKQDAEFNLEKFNEYQIEDKFTKQTAFNSDTRKITSINSDLYVYISEIESVVSNYKEKFQQHKKYSSKFNNDIYKKVLAKLDNVINSSEVIDGERKVLDRIQKDMKSYIDLLNSRKQNLQEEFAEIKKQVVEELALKDITALNLEEYPKLKQQIENISALLQELRKQKNKRQELDENLSILMSNLNNLWHEEFKIVQNHLNSINSKDLSIHIDIEHKGDKSNFLAYMKSIMKGSGIREVSYKKLVDEYPDFYSIYNDFDNLDNIIGTSKTALIEYFNKNLGILLTYRVPDKYIIKYHDKELRQHSLGQRASALMLFVLNQRENDLIIIDQPEDDLDNQTIYDDVIKLICELKGDIQFIFATHNANFPVLGDAGQVHACRLSEKTMTIQSGSIDSPIIQKEIVGIMEGGETAFNRRKEIYGIWKP